jgi:adenine phosphoribosyltransferase
MDVLQGLDSGEKYRWEVPGLPYAVELPLVRVPADGKILKIASLNLVGQVRLNRDIGVLLAKKIRDVVGDLTDVVLLTVVEKGLQLAQVVAEELGLEAMAVAYNRVKPHMEADRRPVLQIGASSITSGGKFLALYERDMNLLARGKRFILLDDVVSTGGTIFSLADLLEEVMRLKQLPPPTISAIFCAAIEGEQSPLLPASVHSVGVLPKPILETA